MKKFGCLLLSALMLASVTACGGGNNSSESSMTSEEAQKFMDTYGDWTDKALEVTAIDKGLGYDWLQDAARTSPTDAIIT